MTALYSRLRTELNVFPCFMPEQDCEPEIIAWIRESRKSIFLEAYKFANKNIARELVEAKKRDLDIKVFADQVATEMVGSAIETLEDGNIKVRTNQLGGRAHNKVMIFDDNRVITGSFNWTERDDSIVDVVIFIKDECSNRKYRENYNCIIETSNIEDLNMNRINVDSSWILQDTVSHFFRNSIEGSFYFNCKPCKTPITGTKRSFSSVDNEGFQLVRGKSAVKRAKAENILEINVCFPRQVTQDNPSQDCIELIIERVESATKSIFIQAYSFTHKRITDRLIYAKRVRSVDVRLLVDRWAHQGEGQKVRYLKNYGIPVKEDEICTSRNGTAHSKNIIIDDDIVLSGSFNLTKSAQNRNLENLITIKHKLINSMFKENFTIRWDKGRDELSPKP